jgi:hypothetical protein
MEDTDMTMADANVAVAAPAAPAAATAVNTQFRTGKDEEKKGGERCAFHMQPSHAWQSIPFS